MYLYGDLNLGEGRTAEERVLNWLQTCEDHQFLDAIECVLQGGEERSISGLEQLVPELNEFLMADGLPYAVTDYVWEESTEDGPYGRRFSQLTQLPLVIRADSQVASASAVFPALNLLSDGRFTSANKEFHRALEDFRKGDLEDALGKCGSTFESVLKIICERRGWPYKQTDTAATLLKGVIANSGLEAWLEQPLMLVATIRNRLSSSHGAGVELRLVTEEKVEYAINATASAILLLVRHCLRNRS
jgi:hypothetical protein